MTDIVNYILPASLAAVIIYAVVMFIVRKVQNGEAFDLNKILQTLGLGTLAAVVLYIATGAVPSVDAVLTQMASILPNPDLLAPIGAVIFGLFEQFIVKGKLGTTPLVVPVPAAALPAAAAAAVVKPAYRDGRKLMDGKDGWYVRLNPSDEAASLPDDKCYQLVSPKGWITSGDKATIIYLATDDAAAGYRSRYVNGF